MKKQFICFVCSLLLVLLNCTTKVSIDLAPSFFGKILDENNNGINSAKAEVINIEAVGHESINDFVERIYYSDENGNYFLTLPGGVEWEEKNISGKKEYTKYIESVTIKVSKISFRDTVVTLDNTNYEKSYVEKDVVLKSNKIKIFKSK